jgi:putative FmdB family regulatory protein
MPLYEYKCQLCGTVFEAIQRFSDEFLTVHENCGGALERLLSPPILQFKGTGWYVTDYARAGAGKKGAKAENDGPAEKKEPAKPEPKPELKPSK